MLLTNNEIKGGGRISKVRRVMALRWPARPSAQCYLVVVDIEDAWLVVGKRIILCLLLE